jgi:bifunctional NMN adenylyltransferase/nudix hydrolase
MILNTVNDSRIVVFKIKDTYDEYKWNQNVYDIVHGIIHRGLGKAALFGYIKDKSSYYLNKLEYFTFVKVEPNGKHINATDIRDIWLNSLALSDISKATEEVIYAVSRTRFNRLKDEYLSLCSYKKQYAKDKYPPIFTTGDAVLQSKGYILVVERNGVYGKGKLALPGGFINHDESILDGIYRELLEETGIDARKFSFDLKCVKVFDAPGRSERGRTITHAAHIVCGDSERPVPKAADDAKNAFWIKFSMLEPEMMFEDHYQIIENLITTIN